MKTRTWGLLILLGVVLFAHGPAWGVSCLAIHSVGDFATAGSCTLADKTYTLEPGDTVIPIGVGMSFVAIGTTQTVSLLFDAVTGLGPQHYTFDYEVDITDPAFVFATVALDSTHGTDTTTITKTEEDGKFATLTSPNGDPDGPESIGGSQINLSVLDDIVISDGVVPGTLVSVTNTFTQRSTTTVPEPSTLILMGIGLATLGVLRRRKLR